MLRVVSSLALSALAAAQAVPTRVEVEAHGVCVYSERLVRFLDDYHAREPEVRKVAWAELDKRRPTMSGVAASPNVEALYFAWRKLLDDEGEGGELAETVAMQRLGAALDLVVAPGVFAARTEGLGEALTITVRPLVAPASVAPAKDFHLALEWISPERAQQRARREPIGPAAIREAGFEMYARAPQSAPGAWQLFGMAAADEAGSIAGLVPAVPVDCVADLAARVERACRPRENEPAGRAYLRRAFELLQRHGLRTTPSMGGARLLETIERWTESDPPPGVHAPTELVFRDATGVEHWLWSARAEAPKGTLLVLGTQREASDTLFAGALGRAWLEVARDASLDLRAAHLTHDTHAILPFIEREKARANGELIVVVRSDALGRFGAVMQGRENPPFDALVLSGVIASSPPAELYRGIERLLIAPSVGGERTSDDSALTWLEGDTLPYLNEPELPASIANWLAARKAVR